VNVLKLAKDVANKVGVSPPTALFGSTQPISLRFVTLIEDEARHLRNMWAFPQQKKPHSFTVSSGRDRYPLPSDFYSTVPGTTYDAQLDRRMIGPLNDGDWNEMVHGRGATNTTAWRISGPDGNPASSGGQFEIYPVPSNSSDIYLFEYLTKNMFYSSTYTSGSETIAADTDVCLFDDDIVLKGVEWRYRESKGQQYATQKAEHDAMVSSAVARWQPTYRGSFSLMPQGGTYTIPDGGWSF
jgi:hypothetical protein